MKSQSITTALTFSFLILFGCKKESVSPVAPTINIEPGIRAGDFYLNDDLSTHFARLDKNKMVHRSSQSTNGYYLHAFYFDDAGIHFLLRTPTDDYTLDDVPFWIEVYPPFEGWTKGEITFGSSFDEVVNVFGDPLHRSSIGDNVMYDEIIFWSDNTEPSVKRISVY